MATVIHQPSEVRSRRLPFASPHGLLYALPISLAMWAVALWVAGAIG